MIRIIKVLLSLILIGLFNPLSVSRVFAQVVINEFVINGSPEWVEFYNASSSADYIKNYYIDDDISFMDDSGTGTRKSLSLLNVSNPTYPFIETSSFFNNPGDWVVLFDQSGNILDQYQYTSDPGKDISIGRYPDNAGTFSVLAYSTKADGNSAPSTPVPTSTSQPTNTPTPTSTPISTPIPTKTPIPTPTKAPTMTPTPTISPTGESSTASGDVLGSEAVIDSPSPVSENKNIVIAIVFVGLGTILIGGSIYWVIRTSKSAKPQNDI
jgi:hypothetical protein